MSDDKLNQTGLSRRSFLGTAAVSGAGIAGAASDRGRVVA